MKGSNSIEKFNQEGFLYFPEFLSSSEIADIQSKLDEIIDGRLQDFPSEHIKYEDSVNKEGIKMIQDLHIYDAFFKKTLFDSKFSALATELLGEPVVGKTVEFFNKPAKVGKATPPHQDGYYFMLAPMSAVTFWISLEGEQRQWLGKLC